jgi:FkbM family methyltransferase
VSALKARCVEALRKLGAHPLVLPFVALLLRARTVRSSAAFLAREAVHEHSSRTYRLRENGLQVRIRHGSGDVVTLGEVFHDHHYVPTAEVEQALGRVHRILDLGANVGLFGAFAAGRWPEAEIEAFEPDPANAELHAQTIALNGLDDRWRLRQAAAGAAAGRVRFAAGGVALSHLVAVGDTAGSGESAAVAPAAPGSLIEVELRDVVGRLGETDLLKMDIEGGEWVILGDPRFRESPPRALVLEYHPRFCPSDDPAAAVDDALRGAGLRVQPIWRRADGHGMLWAWRP